MKKKIMMLGIIFVIVLAGCQSEEDNLVETQMSLSVYEEGTMGANVTISDETESSIVDDEDVDLTVLSSSMVYAQVYDIVSNPDSYLGKTIKIQGSYYETLYEETGLTYHFVIISDATECCQSGLEFMLNDETLYPEDGANVEITGVFSTYEELGQTYYYIDVTDNSISML